MVSDGLSSPRRTGEHGGFLHQRECNPEPGDASRRISSGDKAVVLRSRLRSRRQHDVERGRAAERLDPPVSAGRLD